MAVTVALVLLFLTGLFEYIPSGVLDAVVFTIGIKLVKVGTLRAVGRTSRPEFLVAIVTLLVVAFVGVEQGIFLAIVLSLIDRLRRQYHPHDEVLLSDGHVIPRLESRVKLPAPGQLDDVLVYRFSAPLFFENATYFGERVRAELAATATPVKVLVIDAAAMPDIDYTGAQTLAELGRELRGTGAELVLTEVSEAILHRVATTGIDADLTVVPRLEDAVLVRPTQTRPHRRGPRRLTEGSGSVTAVSGVGAPGAAWSSLGRSRKRWRSLTSIPGLYRPLGQRLRRPRTPRTPAPRRRFARPAPGRRSART